MKLSSSLTHDAPPPSSLSLPPPTTIHTSLLTPSLPFSPLLLPSRPFSPLLAWLTNRATTVLEPPCVNYQLPCVVMFSLSLAPPDNSGTFSQALSKRRGGDWWQRGLCRGEIPVIAKQKRGCGGNSCRCSYTKKEEKIKIMFMY